MTVRCPRRSPGVETIGECAAGSACGTGTGWRRGGRCPGCRRSHNEETNRYRGLSDDRVALIKEQLRAGVGLQAAAEAAGCRQGSVTKRADRDGELAALLAVEGTADRTWINKAVFLAALMACGGVRQRAAERVGVSHTAVMHWKRDPLFAAASDAVAALAASRAQSATAQTFEKFMAEVQAGATLAQAALKCGLSGATLRKFAMRNETLARWWEDARKESFRRASARHPARKRLDEQRVRELWGDHSLGVHAIAAELGVSYPTLNKWARNLELPDRRTVRSGRRRRA